MASGLSARVLAIESAVQLLHDLHDRLYHLRPTMGELIEAAAKRETFAGLDYLAECRDRMRRGEPFPAAWKNALAQRPGALPDEEAALLAALADVLGATDLDSQLTALDCTREQLEHRLMLAREQRQKNHKLYGTLGVLAGVAVAIILI